MFICQNNFIIDIEYDFVHVSSSMQAVYD